jgi:xanthine/uracil permease
MTTATGDVFDIGIDQKLPFNQLLLLGLQNIFCMTGMFVFPGLLGRAFGLPIEQIAHLYGMTFVVCGVTTALQSAGLLRLPVVQGPYAGSFAALMAVGHIKEIGLGGAYGSLFVAALIWCLLSVPIRGFSVVGLFARYMRAPIISGMLVILVMIQIANVALPNWIGTRATPGFPLISFGTGLIAVALVMGCTIWGAKSFRRAAVLIGLVGGTACFALFQPVTLSAVAAAPWIVTPSLFPFGFAVHVDLVIIFLLTLIPAAMGSMAMYQIVADWGGQRLSSSRMSEGVLAIGLGALIAGLFGGFSTLAYPDNIGLLRSSRVGSRYATLCAGLILIVLGCCVKFDMLLVLVPLPVLSAIATLLFGIVFMHGIHMLVNVQWNDRLLMSGGLALLIGLGGLFVDPSALAEMPLIIQLLLKQPVVSGGVVLVVLHALLCRDESMKVVEARGVAQKA